MYLASMYVVYPCFIYTSLAFLFLYFTDLIMILITTVCLEVSFVSLYIYSYA